MNRAPHSSKIPGAIWNAMPTVGCGSLLGAAVAFMLAPMIQRRLARLMPISGVRFGPALVIIVLGAVIGAAVGLHSLRTKKW